MKIKTEKPLGKMTKRELIDVINQANIEWDRKYKNRRSGIKLPLFNSISTQISSFIKMLREILAKYKNIQIYLTFLIVAISTILLCSLSEFIDFDSMRLIIRIVIDLFLKKSQKNQDKNGIEK